MDEIICKHNDSVEQVRKCLAKPGSIGEDVVDAFAKALMYEPANVISNLKDQYSYLFGEPTQSKSFCVNVPVDQGNQSFSHHAATLSKENATVRETVRTIEEVKEKENFGNILINLFEVDDTQGNDKMLGVGLHEAVLEALGLCVHTAKHMPHPGQGAWMKVEGRTPAGEIFFNW
jgi:hypothetical protein